MGSGRIQSETFHLNILSYQDCKKDLPRVADAQPTEEPQPRDRGAEGRTEGTSHASF